MSRARLDDGSKPNRCIEAQSLPDVDDVDDEDDADDSDLVPDDFALVSFESDDELVESDDEEDSDDEVEPAELDDPPRLSVL